MTVAIAAALAAGVLFYLFAQHEKSSSTTAAAPVSQTVFIATKYIPAGTAAQELVSQGFLARTTVASNQLVAGAIADPSVIANTVTDAAVAKGQQISVSDFSRTNVSYSAYLSGDQRAMALSLDPQQGFTAHLAANDTVDIIGDVGTKGPAKMLAQNITVLGNTGGEVDIRVTDRQAIGIAEAADGAAKIWLILRPSVDAKNSVGYTIPITGTN